MLLNPPEKQDTFQLGMNGWYLSRSWVAIALLFFPEIPYEEEDGGEEKIKASFRSLPAKQLQMLPPSVKLLLRKGRCFQLILHKLTGGFNPDQKLITPPLQLTDHRDVRDWALKTRDLLGIDIRGC